MRPPKGRSPPRQQHREDKPRYYIADTATEQPDYPDVEELVLADYVSSHSYLDSVFTRINVDQVNLNVEFPEFGKCLMESPVQCPQSQTAIRTKTWGDNWEVEGVEKFEEQVFIELEEKKQKKKEKSPLSPEIVPFLVPNGGLAKVVIGDRDIDNVSELSEKMSEGSIEFSSSLEEEEEEMIRTSHDVELELPMPDQKTRSLVLVSAPSDLTLEAGRLLSLSCVVEGVRPIGRDLSAYFSKLY